MGQECATVCRWDGKVSEGKALLEGDHLLFRGGFRLRILFRELTGAETADGKLILSTPCLGRVELDIGAKAGDWLRRIRNPRGLLDKLGLKPGDKVDMLGADPDPVLSAVLDAAGIAPDRLAAPRPDVPWVLLTATGPAHLDLVPAIAETLGPKSALWVLFPKGGRAFPESLLRDTARGAGLADIKTCAVSEVTTALKWGRRKG
ncbi:hypothetical protein HHL28_00600 [Aerophototrophica crusticola]|uniref:DUF3052 domain-containing protein n=1 Tax=Aerophototrophica crusticola TaxID=1709002 RepID=A0A858R333_9PROT|nr:hypothetical protein HHL28_00600 [Rhodospirillaceae bacterium B3]